jgi:hypothetical protein
MSKQESKATRYDDRHLGWMVQTRYDTDDTWGACHLDCASLLSATHAIEQFNARTGGSFSTRMNIPQPSFDELASKDCARVVPIFTKETEKD